jgi:hypothetical protein
MNALFAAVAAEVEILRRLLVTLAAELGGTCPYRGPRVRRISRQVLSQLDGRHDVALLASFVAGLEQLEVEATFDDLFEFVSKLHDKEADMLAEWEES